MIGEHEATDARTPEPDDGPVVGVSNVDHAREGTSVLESVSLSIHRGETLAVIGPSGTGKTTLLRLLSLFDPPDEGRIRVGGVDPWAVSERDRLPVRRRLALVFQEPNLFDASVERNVAYGPHVRRNWPDRVRHWLARFRDDSVDGTVEEPLEVVGLADRRDEHVSALSGGERQRVAFARALACDPEVLLLDEPTSDLDPRNTALIEDAVETARSRGLGVAIATHDMHQAERVADRVAVVLDGSLVEVGPADRVFTDPEDPRTRRFVEGDLVY